MLKNTFKKQKTKMKLWEFLAKVDLYKTSLNYVQDKKFAKGTIIGGIYTLIIITLLTLLFITQTIIIIKKEKYNTVQYSEKESWKKQKIENYIIQ